MSATGVVVIGRNEGERLRKCLASVLGQTERVVYVDSGSTDGSVELAGRQGVVTVDLDLEIPFTAARARNAGFARLRQQWPELEFVQFVDGDCELEPSWLDAASAALQDHPDWGVVLGRLRERYPEASIYNRFCDMEWNPPIGEAWSCGGIALMRIRAFAEVDGFRESLIAGEEAELCLRLRQAGWKVHRLAHEMASHDAAMTRFGQWWKRNLRSGHAVAEVSRLHRHRKDNLWQHAYRSNFLWGLWLPVGALAAAPVTWGVSIVAGLSLFGVQYRRIAWGRQVQGDAPQVSRLYARYCLVGKFPQALGQLRYHWRRLRRQPIRLIEYKAPASPRPPEASVA